jgi:hypothetical protein
LALQKEKGDKDKEIGVEQEQERRPLFFLVGSVPLTFSFAQLAKGKSLGRSKPATNSQAQGLTTHCVEYSTISKSY